jgi:hypothetical protein
MHIWYKRKVPHREIDPPGVVFSGEMFIYQERIIII